MSMSTPFQDMHLLQYHLSLASHWDRFSQETKFWSHHQQQRLRQWHRHRHRQHRLQSLRLPSKTIHIHNTISYIAFEDISYFIFPALIFRLRLVNKWHPIFGCHLSFFHLFILIYENFSDIISTFEFLSLFYVVVLCIVAVDIVFFFWFRSGCVFVCSFCVHLISLTFQMSNKYYTSNSK